MRVTINKDLISELYPVERKNLFNEYGHLEFYLLYKKGEVRRHGFLWIQKDIVTEDIFCQWFSDKWYTKSEAIKNSLKTMVTLKTIRRHSLTIVIGENLVFI